MACGSSDFSETPLSPHPRTLSRAQKGPEIFILVTLTTWKGESLSVSLRIPCFASSRHPNRPAPSRYADLCFIFTEGGRWEPVPLTKPDSVVTFSFNFLNNVKIDVLSEKRSESFGG